MYCVLYNIIQRPWKECLGLLDVLFIWVRTLMVFRILLVIGLRSGHSLSRVWWCALLARLICLVCSQYCKLCRSHTVLPATETVSTKYHWLSLSVRQVIFL